MTELRRAAAECSANAWDALAREQEATGEFRAARRFNPGVSVHGRPSRFDGWYDFGECPFFTATIVLHLGYLRDPGPTQAIRARACEFLQARLEGGLSRYVPGTSQDIWFPPDVDDTALVLKVLRDHGREVTGADATLLNNRHPSGGFYTWFVPRWTHARNPAVLAWLIGDWARWTRRLATENLRNCWRLQREYWSTSEPAVDANVLLYFGHDERVRGLDTFIVHSLAQASCRLEYYDSLIGAYFHAARLHGAGWPAMAPLADAAEALIRERQASSSGMLSGLDSAMAALTLMYFQRADSPCVASLIRSLVGDRMNHEGWRPVPYVNPVNRAFSDGSAGFTATLYAEAMGRFADPDAYQPTPGSTDVTDARTAAARQRR